MSGSDKYNLILRQQSSDSAYAAKTAALVFASFITAPLAVPNAAKQTST